MTRAFIFFVVLVASAFGDEKPAKRTPKITVSLATTRVTEPLDEDGYVDYAAALNRHLGKGVTPQNNANVLLWRAIGPHPDGLKTMGPEYFKWLGVDEPPEKRDYFVGLQGYARDVLKLGTYDEQKGFYDQETRASQRPWTAREHPDVAAWLKANEKPLKLVAEAAKRPEYFNPIVVRRTEKGSQGLISALLPSAQVCRAMGRALTARAMLHAGEGRFDEAWQDLLACHRLGRLVARGATLIELLVGIAIDNMASAADLAFLERATFSSDRLRACLGDLHQLPPLPGVADKMERGERYMALDAIQLMERHGFDSLESGSIAPPKKTMSANDRAALDSLDWDLMMRNANGWYARLVAILRVEKRAEREKLLGDLDREWRELRVKAVEKGGLAGVRRLFMGRREASQTISDVLLSLMLPAHQRIQQAADKVEQTHRNLRLAFALAAYRYDHKRYPKKLDDLIPKHVSQVPSDLFSDRALIYRPGEKGYLLYSVGVNGKDDEGRGDRDEPRGDDLSIRLPLAELPRK